MRSTVMTDGYAWPSKVFIANSEEGMPKPPSTVPEVDQATLLKKLSVVGKSTTLGLPKERVSKWKVESSRSLIVLT